MKEKALLKSFIDWASFPTSENTDSLILTLTHIIKDNTNNPTDPQKEPLPKLEYLIKYSYFFIDSDTLTNDKVAKFVSGWIVKNYEEISEENRLPGEKILELGTNLCILMDGRNQTIQKLQQQFISSFLSWAESPSSEKEERLKATLIEIRQYVEPVVDGATELDLFLEKILAPAFPSIMAKLSRADISIDTLILASRKLSQKWFDEIALSDNDQEATNRSFYCPVMELTCRLLQKNAPIFSPEINTLNQQLERDKAQLLNFKQESLRNEVQHFLNKVKSAISGVQELYFSRDIFDTQLGLIKIHDVKDRLVKLKADIKLMIDLHIQDKVIVSLHKTTETLLNALSTLEEITENKIIDDFANLKKSMLDQIKAFKEKFPLKSSSSLFKKTENPSMSHDFLNILQTQVHALSKINDISTIQNTIHTFLNNALSLSQDSGRRFSSRSTAQKNTHEIEELKELSYNLREMLPHVPSDFNVQESAQEKAKGLIWRESEANEDETESETMTGNSSIRAQSCDTLDTTTTTVYHH